MIANKAVLLTVGALAGCAAHPVETAPTPAPTQAKTVDPAALAHVDENLARLRALQVVDVGQMIVDAPEGITFVRSGRVSCESVLCGRRRHRRTHTIDRWATLACGQTNGR